RWAGEVRSATARYDCVHSPGIGGGGFQRRCAARARSEKADFKPLRMRICLEPGRGFHETFGQQLDVEPQMPRLHVDFLFLLAEQIEEERREPSGPQNARDELIAR